MARPRGSGIGRTDPKLLRARRDGIMKRKMRELRLAAGRKRIWVDGPDGKIMEKWI